MATPVPAPVPPTELLQRWASVDATRMVARDEAVGRARQMTAIGHPYAEGPAGVVTMAQASNWTTNHRPVPVPVVDALLGEVTTRLVTDPEALHRLILDPGSALQACSPSPTAEPPFTWWPPAALLLTACLRAVDAISSGTAPPAAALSVQEAERLRPLAVINVFLTLTEPLRHLQSPQWWPGVSDQNHQNSGPVGALFGKDSWHIYIRETRRARADLLDFLDTYQDHPKLAALRPHHLEALLALTVWRHGRPGELLTVPDEAADLTAATTIDRESVRHIAERHWLPRFALWPVIRGAVQPAMSGGSPWLRRVAVTAAGLAALLFAAQFILYVKGHAAAAAVTGVTGYLAVGVSALAGGSLCRFAWMLRLPAAAGVGGLVLITLPSSWWKAPPAGWIWAYLLLGAASMAYLIVECLGHGVAPGRVYRAVGVWVAALIHALSISMIILVFVVPAFADSGAALQGLLQAPDLVPRLQAWGAATAWCLAVGILSQIIWDDQAITAPLAHVTWRKGT